ncbi:MAG: hypothetical protein K9H64_21830 [Bacteroidales bacterium]|nr:hypothetical protein [Bacteroidales bacterium]MCF8458669.1 hypothetical protein [Bacteroidales bacterium]
MDEYRFGFQGQEKDDEVKGAGNSINYKYRMHDPRIGRFFAVDPLTAKYPFYSPYAFSGNRVIDCIELEGLEPEGYQHRLKGTMEIGMSFGLQIQGEVDFLGSIGLKLQGLSMEGNTTYNFEYLVEDEILNIYSDSESKNVEYAIGGSILDIIGGEISKQSGVNRSEELDKGTVSTKKALFGEIKSIDGKEDETTWKGEFSFGVDVRALVGFKAIVSGEVSYAPLKGQEPEPSKIDKTTTKTENFKSSFDLKPDED